MKHALIKVLGVVALVFALSVGTVPASHAEPSAGAGITGVRATDAQITVTGRASAGVTVSVYALGAEQADTAWSSGTPVASAVAAGDGTFSAAVSREGDTGRLYYAKYVAVANGAMIGTDHFVDDVQVTPTNAYPYPTSPTKKGLQVQLTADAEELGVGHAAINVALNGIMQLHDAGNGASIPFVSQGQTYYFSTGAVGSLDRQIKPLSDNGSVVNLILILYRDGNPNSAWPILKHPDADLAGGPVFAFNTVTAQGLAYYTAAMEFLAQRYTRDDQQFGRATGFIVGNEIDAQWDWQNMGRKPLADFLADYEKALRITDLATRAVYREARTYTSLTHGWTRPVVNRDGWYYPVKDVVDGLNALTKAHGDYPWNIAYHPYPHNLTDPRFWNDPDSTTDPDTTPEITFRNIEVLPEYLARSALTYDGAQRRVILSEQGCNTPRATPEDERNQAACYALAYYKVAFLPGIDSFILHRHVDHQGEGGLRLGLWWWDDTVPAPAAPKSHKLSYDVFKAIDTADSLKATKFALDVIGISDWSELVPGFDPAKLAVRTPPTTVGASRTARPMNATTLMSFDAGTDGWRVSDAVDRVSVVDGALRAHFTWEPGLAAQLAQLWRGTDVVLPNPIDPHGAAALSLKIRIPADASLGTRYVKIKIYDPAGHVTEGTTRLADGGDWQQASVDLSKFTGSIARIKVWVRGSTQAMWTGSFDIDDVQLAGALGGADKTGNLDITAAAPEGIGAGKPISITVANNDLRPISDPVSVLPCDGVALDPDVLPTAGLAVGASQTYTSTVARSTPADPYHPALCLRSAGFTYRIDVTVPPKPIPVPTTLYDFDDGTTQGWQAGPGMVAVSAITSTANGPGAPAGGSYMLDGQSEPTSSLLPKTMFVIPPTPLDLSGASRLVVSVDSYGGAPNATGYQVTVTVSSGSATKTVTTAYSPDRWNEVSLDLAGWAGRSAIGRIEVTMQAVGGDYPAWGAHFQVDSVGWYA